LTEVPLLQDQSAPNLMILPGSIFAIPAAVGAATSSLAVVGFVCPEMEVLAHCLEKSYHLRLQQQLLQVLRLWEVLLLTWRVMTQLGRVGALWPGIHTVTPGVRREHVTL
jgi:hypothetical protein